MKLTMSVLRTIVLAGLALGLWTVATAEADDDDKTHVLDSMSHADPANCAPSCQRSTNADRPEPPPRVLGLTVAVGPVKLSETDCCAT